MQSRQSQYKQMQTKFEEGMQVLEGILDDEDHLALNAALIKIHSALEDFVRLEVGERAPHLREAVADPRQTNWKSLLDYGTTYLAFTKSDRDIISEANQQRQTVAHGGNYEKKISDLKRYARFVQKWLKRASISPAGDDWGKEQIIEQRPAVPMYEPESRPAYQPPPAPVYEPERYSAADRPTPWYRSTLFLFITFFLLPPVWAMLILTDRRHGCLPRAWAAFILSLILVICAAFVFPASTYRNAIEKILGTYETTPQPTLVPLQDFVPPTLDASPPSLPTTDSVTSDSPAACDLVWVEHTSDDLGGKNRSMVWDEIVSRQVEGSGMSASEFNRLVLDQNPELVADSYEFKSGKTYLLPECR